MVINWTSFSRMCEPGPFFLLRPLLLLFNVFFVSFLHLRYLFLVLPIFFSFFLSPFFSCFAFFLLPNIRFFLCSVLSLLLFSFFIYLLSSSSPFSYPILLDLSFSLFLLLNLLYSPFSISSHLLAFVLYSLFPSFSSTLLSSPPFPLFRPIEKE